MNQDRVYLRWREKLDLKTGRYFVEYELTSDKKSASFHREIAEANKFWDGGRPELEKQFPGYDWQLIDATEPNHFPFSLFIIVGDRKG